MTVLRQTTAPQSAEEAAEQPFATPPSPPGPATVAQQPREVEEVERGAQQGMTVVASKGSAGAAVVDAEVDDEPQTLESRMRQDIERCGVE